MGKGGIWLNQHHSILALGRPGGFGISGGMVGDEEFDQILWVIKYWGWGVLNKLPLQDSCSWGQGPRTWPHQKGASRSLTKIWLRRVSLSLLHSFYIYESELFRKDDLYLLFNLFIYSILCVSLICWIFILERVTLIENSVSLSSEVVLNSPSFLKDVFASCKILGWQLFSLALKKYCATSFWPSSLLLCF